MDTSEHLITGLRTRQRVLPNLRRQRSNTVNELGMGQASVLTLNFSPHRPRQPPNVTRNLDLRTHNNLLPNPNRRAI